MSMAQDKGPFVYVDEYSRRTLSVSNWLRPKQISEEVTAIALTLVIVLYSVRLLF